MVTDTKQMVCRKCQKGFDSAIIMVGTLRVAEKYVCDPCLESVNNFAELDPISFKTKDLPFLWKNVCPPLYRDSDPSRLKINPDTISNVLTWENNPHGIGLAGESGTGKTRLMFMLVKRLLEEGIRVRATTAKQFENWCHRMFNKDDDARLRIEECHQARVLFIDDIGKEKYTERVESEFYDLVEDRTSHLLPILWTANATGEKLIQMMGDDRGVPIVRRLREFSEVISI